MSTFLTTLMFSSIVNVPVTETNKSTKMIYDFPVKKQNFGITKRHKRIEATSRAPNRRSTWLN